MKRSISTAAHLSISHRPLHKRLEYYQVFETANTRKLFLSSQPDKTMLRVGVKWVDNQIIIPNRTLSIKSLSIVNKLFSLRFRRKDFRMVITKRREEESGATT